MQLTSSAFQHEGKFPAKFTCDGENTSPEFSWRDAPAKTRSFALLMHDPDAPRAGGFTHWVVYNIPASVAAVQPNVPAKERIEGVGVHGKNDYGKFGYMGPCPPSGTHRYFVRLYALDIELSLKPGASYQQVQEAVRGHVLAEAELMGTYARGSERVA
jgi:Raf kinase inhibitor-like YbhB/YbcL family protein